MPLGAKDHRAANELRTVFVGRIAEAVVAVVVVLVDRYIVCHYLVPCVCYAGHYRRALPGITGGGFPGFPRGFLAGAPNRLSFFSPPPPPSPAPPRPLSPAFRPIQPPHP